MGLFSERNPWTQWNTWKERRPVGEKMQRGVSVWWSIFTDKVTFWKCNTFLPAGYEGALITMLGNVTLWWWWDVKWGVLHFGIWILVSSGDLWPLKSIGELFSKPVGWNPTFMFEQPRSKRIDSIIIEERSRREDFRTVVDAAQKVTDHKCFFYHFLSSFKSLPVKKTTTTTKGWRTEASPLCICIKNKRANQQAKLICTIRSGSGWNLARSPSCIMHSALLQWFSFIRLWCWNKGVKI